MTTRNRTMNVLTLAVAGLVLALAPAAQAGTISAGDPLIAGSGLSAGDTFQLVFVTSVNMGPFTKQEENLNVYDQFVNGVANNAGAGSIVAAHGWSWEAIGSVQAGFPIPSPYHHARNWAVVSAPVYNLNAELVATGFADMWDGSLANPIKYTEQGTAAASDVKVNTGTRANGYQDTASHREYSLCGDQGTRTGNPHATDGTWIYGDLIYIGRGRAPTGPLYGLSEALQVLADNAAPVADADGPYTVNYGDTLDLDGTGSTDDSGIVSYDWDIAGVLSASGAMDSSITWQDLVDAGLSAGGAIDLTVTDDGTPGLTGTDGTTFTVGAAPSVIPEPSTFLIWALGLLGLIGFGRRRKR